MQGLLAVSAWETSLPGLSELQSHLPPALLISVLIPSLHRQTDQQPCRIRGPPSETPEFKDDTRHTEYHRLFQSHLSSLTLFIPTLQ